MARRDILTSLSHTLTPRPTLAPLHRELKGKSLTAGKDHEDGHRLDQGSVGPALRAGHHPHAFWAQNTGVKCTKIHDIRQTLANQTAFTKVWLKNS